MAPGSDSLVAADDFPASRRNTYLNTASVALVYSGAQRALIDWQVDISEHGTASFDERAEASVFEGLHDAAARLLGTRPEDIAVGSNATELWGSLAWAVAPPEGSNIVTSEAVFPSTVYPWARVARHTGAEVRYAPERRDGTPDDDVMRLIDDRTAVVCVSHVEYGGGHTFDLADLTQAAHDHDALIVVDATQSAGAIPIDVIETGVDALVTAGYKWLCGPFGVAFLYLARHLQEQLDPGVVGFRSHRDMWDLRADRIDYPESARRFEVSTMAYGCALGLTESVRYLMRLGVERIAAHNSRLAAALTAGLRERGAEIASVGSSGPITSSIVAARFPGTDSPKLAAGLNGAGVVVSPRGDWVRFSPHLYNDDDDIERALAQIDRLRA